MGEEFSKFRKQVNKHTEQRRRWNSQKVESDTEVFNIDEQNVAAELSLYVIKPAFADWPSVFYICQLNKIGKQCQAGVKQRYSYAIFKLITAWI